MNSIFQQMSFPHSWEKGASQEGLQIHKMRQRALMSQPLNAADFAEKVTEHYRFLREGGAGGTWKLLTIGGLVIPLYQKKELTARARQFSLEYGQVANGVGFTRLVLPYINCCAAHLPQLEASGATLSGSLFTDCLLEKANFQKANLQGVDFSRAELVDADFRGADLGKVDFENCNLRGADFRGARIVGARFPGANLRGVKS